MFDPHGIKNDFPIFQTKLSSGKPLVYLDSAATSQKPRVVIDAIAKYYEHDNANVHRGIHELGDRSTSAWHTARQTIADFLGAKPQELVVTRNATEALNEAAYLCGEQYVGEGDVLLATQMDHHSNLVPWQELAKRKGVRLELVPVTSEGILDLLWLEQFLKTNSKKLRLVAFPYVSNTLGTINPVQHIVELVHRHSSALIVLDAAQAASHMPIRFDELNIDFLAVSAHKMLGPMGIGALLVRAALLKTVEPWIFGGGMIGEVQDADATWSDDLEDRFTAGTPDVVGMVGWAAACQYLQDLGMLQVAEHDRALVEYTLAKLSGIENVKVVGPHEKRCGSVAFVYQGVHAHDVAQILSSEGVAVRSGHHCTMPLHHHMGWAATTRISFNVYSTKEDIDACMSALTKVKTIFG